MHYFRKIGARCSFFFDVFIIVLKFGLNVRVRKIWVKRKVFLIHEAKIEFLTHFRVFTSWGF